MTDEDIEKIIKRNMNLQMNLAGIRADFEEATQRKPLTIDQIASIAIDRSKPDGIVAFVRAIEAAHNIKE